jgi:hypothetical protein
MCLWLVPKSKCVVTGVSLDNTYLITGTSTKQPCRFANSRWLVRSAAQPILLARFPFVLGFVLGFEEPGQVM